MKTIYSLLIVVIFAFTTKTNAQNYYYAVFIGDTIQLSVDGINGTATIQWQETNDTTNTWTNISGATTNPFTLQCSSSSTGFKYYRAEITDASVCANPYHSPIIKHRIITESNQAQIGDWYAGGLIFYKDAYGGGLVAAIQDQNTAIKWGCSSSITGANNTSIGTGQENTDSIVSQCTGTNAAYICDTLTLNGYTDWFLPSIDELGSIYTNLHLNGLGSFTDVPYWSSSQFDADTAICFNFNGSGQFNALKTYPLYVRAVRIFNTYTMPVVDFDGNSYNTIQIGSQIWMAENLKVTHYPNGDVIPNVTDNTAWGNLADNNTDDAYCWYDNSTANRDIYGGLYTYAAAIADNWARDNTAGQGVCPDGWHLPTEAEWTVLTDYLEGESVAGGKMKEIGTTHWANPNEGATNESGFSALPGGYRSYGNGTFSGVGINGNWRSSTENSNAYYCSLYYYSIGANCYYNNKSNGFSVRCIKN